MGCFSVGVFLFGWLVGWLVDLDMDRRGSELPWKIICDKGPQKYPESVFKNMSILIILKADLFFYVEFEQRLS